MPLKFPKGKKCAVCLTFDFDAISVWLESIRSTYPDSISRGEFGARVGIYRVLDLLDKYGIKSTFFVPGHTADTFPEAVRAIHLKGHEIAHHGHSHKSPGEMSYEEEIEDLEKGIESLRKITDQNPKGYRAPDCYTSPNTFDLLVERGFNYDSSMMREDFRLHKCRRGDKIHDDGRYEFGEEIDLLEMPVSWDQDDFPPFELYEEEYVLNPGLASPSAVFEIWSGNFEYMYNHMEGGVYILANHPQTIGRGHRILMLERLIKYIQKHSGVWFTPLIQLVGIWED